jgi:transglutaminase-like putative cysteine protease
MTDAPSDADGKIARPSVARILQALALCFLAAGCAREQSSPPPASVVTADIQAGIERHIAEQVQRGGGFFDLTFGDQELRLQLVRVHTEYLASLGPGSHFACVDLVDRSGDVYDVDFFLAGEAGAMVVTETMVHKKNGRPYYAWQQKSDGTWHRIPIAAASPRDLGVIEGRDTFEFVYRATLPEIGGPARMWLPLAASDTFQTVEVISITAPGSQRVLEDNERDNRVLFLELDPGDSERTVEIRYRVERLEKSAYGERGGDLQRYLAPERMVPDDERFRTIAAKILDGKQGDLMRARAIYDHVIDEMRYMKHGSGWGRGDAIHACDIGTGNCTDYHAYFIALARAAGIPARFAIGASIPSERDAGRIAGYHCWAEFHAEGQWWPVDISEADKYSRLATYYFGRHPANRLEFSRGRDLVVEPGPASGPINFLAYPVLEVEGRTVRADVEFSFRRL